jgi:hypothetical protein
MQDDLIEARRNEELRLLYSVTVGDIADLKQQQ